MRFLLSEKAVSEVVGYAIILGITITGIAMIVLVGLPSIYKLQDMTTVKDVEQAFTFSNTKASGTLLGDAPIRVAQINLGGGTVTVEPNGTGTNGTGSGSYISIKSMNNTFNITVPMGKVIYRYGDSIIGYEGGGVWSKYPSGSVMVSPPEFHYDGRTLIFPILTVNGNATVGGKGTATVTFKKNTTMPTMVLFPNTTLDKNRTNPIDYNVSGKVYVNITSDFYDAWAEYARSLSYTNVITNPANHTTNIVLTVVPTTFGGSTVIQNPVSLKGLPSDDTTPLDNFSFKIKPQGSNLDWDLRAQSSSGNKKLIFFLKDDNNWVINNTVTLKIGYQEGSGSGTAEMWEGDSIYTIQQDKYIYVDFLNKSLNLTYTGTNVGSQASCTPNKITNGDFNNTGFSWGGASLSTNSLYNITQHYIWKMSQTGDIYLNNCPSSGNKAPSNSTMVVNYSATGAITFLQISNNTADVSIS